MAKVLVSFLGIGQKNREYKSAKYKIDNKFYETSFVSAAIIEHLNIDKKIVIGTSKSMWEEYYHFFAEKENTFDESIYYELVESIDNTSFSEYNDNLEILNTSLLNTSIIQIKYGLNEEELRYNLNKIIEIENIINDGDELYIDVTHGFRTFPLLAQYAINYLKQISNKNIYIKGYFYGMLEAIKDLGYAPLINMGILNDLNDLIIGASEFKNNSNGLLIANIILKDAPKASKKIRNFSKAISINYSHEIRNQINQLAEIDFQEIPEPERYIVKKVFDDFLKRFKDSDDASTFQLKLAEWYFDNNIYGASYIFLTEAIISKVVEERKINDDVFNKEARDSAKKKISSYNKELGKVYTSVNKIRRNIAHALNSRHNTYLNDITSLEKNIKKVINLFK